MQPRSLEDTATHRRQGNPPGDPAWDHRARTSHQHMLPRKDSSNYKGTTPQTHQAGANLIAVIFVTNWIVQLKITDVNMRIFTCKIGVATIVQGTIVQGNSSPRDISPMTQLSKQTIVQGDFCPRSTFDVVKAAHIIFCSLYNTLVW